MIFHARLHRSHALGLMNPAEIVVHVVERNRVLQILSATLLLVRHRSRPRSRTWSRCWICAAHHFKLRHHPIVLVLDHVAVEHVHAHMIGELQFYL